MENNALSIDELRERIDNELEPDSDNQEPEHQELDLGEQVPEVAPEPETEEPVDDFVPNHKFKVMDEEHEFDDFMKPVVNRDNQERIRELYEKANGLDHVKTKYASLKEQYGQTEQKYNQQSESLGYMGSLINEKNYDTLFNELKISDEDIMAHALKKIEYQNLPEEERQMHENAAANDQRVQNLEYENNIYKKQIYDNRTHDRVTELDRHLASDEVKSVMEEFDGRVGTPGAFRNEVIQRGKMAFMAEKQDISVQEAVGQVIGLYGNRPSPVEAAQTPSQTVVNRQRPVIPNVRSGGHSPARKYPTSIEDLKALQKQYE